MAEYIDKAKLYNTIAKLEEKARKHYLENLESSVLSENAERAFARLSERTAFKHLVADFRAADVVEVVRCRECILHEDFMKDGLLYCNRSNSVVKPNGFCNYGKKDLEESK